MREAAALAPETANSLPALFRQAAAVTAVGSKSFYFATRFFPADLARAAHAVYWFCRYTDDIADECEHPEEGKRELQEWEASLRLAMRTESTQHPVLRVFLDTAREYNIPMEYAFDLIEGMRMDLNGTRYRTFDELRVFCYRVASVVGLMMSSVVGLCDERHAEAARLHAVDLGIAMQLTNILRDIGEDLERERIYLPSEEMEQFGYSERDLRAHVRDENFRRLMQYQVDRARRFYRQGNAGIRMLNPNGRFAVKIASDVYRHILRRIESSEFDVFGQRAVVPARQKYWLTARNMALPMARHSFQRLGLSRLAFWNS